MKRFSATTVGDGGGRPSKSMRMSVSRNTMTLGSTLGRTVGTVKDTRPLQDKQVQKSYMERVKRLLTSLEYHS